MSTESSRAEFIAARNAAMRIAGAGWEGHDDSDPTAPTGYERGLRVSTRLTSYFRETHRSNVMDITPRQVMDCLKNAGVKNWVLMGLHGYVGYLPMPRATQDVDVMVPYSEKDRATQAIQAQWPALIPTAHSQVVRFADPADLGLDGKPQVVVDIMLPWSPFQETILAQQVKIDEKTGDRLPTIEAAVVSKYAALVSPYRAYEKKSQDAADLRKLIKANRADINNSVLRDLAEQIFEGGGVDILIVMDQAINDQPFEI